MRLAFVLLIIAPIIVSSEFKRTPDRLRDESLNGENNPEACFTKQEISNAVLMLESGKAAEVNRISALILAKSRKSTMCKNEIVAGLMKAMDRPNLNFMYDNKSYNVWLYGADLLGQLKASEALDLLISHLTLTNGAFSMSRLHQPALRGVIKMGPVAIPKLSAVLRDNQDQKMRYFAIYCITRIGGESAIAALKAASESESDECAKRLIRASLKSFDEKGNIQNQLEWHSSFTCNP